MSVTVNINWKTVTDVVDVGAMAGLKLSAEYVLSLSKQHCPHDTGTLENSGGTDVKLFKAQVFYDTPYAARLHEHPEYNFQGKGQGKWLENALTQSNVQIIQLMKMSIGRGF